MTDVLSPSRGAGTVFAVDANIFIQAHRDDYPPDIFPGVWNALERAGSEGAIVTTPRVHAEVTWPSELVDWMQDHEDTLVVDASSPDVQDSYRVVMAWVRAQARFSDRARRQFEAGADVELVAVARARGLVVMTNEQPAPDSSLVKIPDVCRAFGLEVASLLDLFHYVGVRFGELYGDSQNRPTASL